MKKESKEKDNRIKRSLKGKMNILIIIFVLLLSSAIILVGCLLYQKAVMNSYDKEAYDIAETVEAAFNEGEIPALVQLLDDYKSGAKPDATPADVLGEERYNQLDSFFLKVRESFSANDIFLGVIDEDVLNAFTPEAREKGEWKPINYIIDHYMVAGEDMKFGDTSSMVPEFIEDVKTAIKTGNRVERFIESDTRFGWNMTAIHPVLQDGKTIACIFVEIPMPTLKADVWLFALTLAGIAAILLIVVIIILTTMIGKMVIAPIMIMAHEANHFVSADTAVSDRLPTIKTKDEIQMLSESLLTMELSINDYIKNITEITAEKERIGAELDIATGIQASMLPSDFGTYDFLKEFDLYATMHPAKEVGGDFYDFFLTDATHVALVMADVSGKGVPAALFMAKGKTAIKTRAMMGGDPADILTDVNDQMCEGNEAELFVTVWLAIIDLKTGKGRAANAGHEHPALRHKDGTFELIKYRHSPAVATMEGMIFKDHEFELLPGDTLFVYTDGVTEATDAHDELFGEERLTDALNVDPNAIPKDLLHNVRAGIDAFVGEAPQFDDITMLGFRYFGKGD